MEREGRALPTNRPRDRPVTNGNARDGDFKLKLIQDERGMGPLEQRQPTFRAIDEFI